MESRICCLVKTRGTVDSSPSKLEFSSRSSPFLSRRSRWLLHIIFLFFFSFLHFSKVHARSFANYASRLRLSLLDNFLNVYTVLPLNTASLLLNCETQPPASIGWVALSSVVRSSFVVCPALVTPPLISTIWCFWPYKPYIFCEDLILATCQCHHMLSWAQFTVV